MPEVPATLTTVPSVAAPTVMTRVGILLHESDRAVADLRLQVGELARQPVDRTERAADIVVGGALDRVARRVQLAVASSVVPKASATRWLAVSNCAPVMASVLARRSRRRRRQSGARDALLPVKSTTVPSVRRRP